MDRKKIADIIIDKLEMNESSIRESVNKSINKIGYFYLDDLLPEDYVKKLYNVFPETKDMVLKKDLREYKYIGVQMSKYDSLLEESIYAFQDQRIVDFMAKIFNLEKVYPDPNLYAGGISVMKKNNFLNPHLDNSHDKDRNRWRVLNLLYYVTPGWGEDYGGDFEIWGNGINKSQIRIHSKFNRLVVMITHNSAWHSVSPIKYNGNRCCISNYYFSDFSAKNNTDFHVTSFRARPQEKIKDIILRLDSVIRMSIRSFFKMGIKKEFHIYKDKNK